MLKELQDRYGEEFNWFEPLNKESFEIELLKELVPTHLLFGISLKAVAKNDRNDDVLFYDGVDFYLIHLTWNKGTDDYPHYKKISADILKFVLEQDYLYG